MKVTSVLFIKTLFHLFGLLPFIWLIFSVNLQLLSADPAKDIQHFTGLMALRLLTLNALVPSLAYYLKINSIYQTRKLLGIWCFFWATLHIISYLLLEIGWNNVSLFFEEIISRSYLFIGLICWCCLLIMVMSSINQLKIKLGAWWKKIHRLFYPTLFLVIIHYMLSTKVLTLEPFIYLALMILAYFHRFKNR